MYIVNLRPCSPRLQREYPPQVLVVFEADVHRRPQRRRHLVPQELPHGSTSRVHPPQQLAQDPPSRHRVVGPLARDRGASRRAVLDDPPNAVLLQAGPEARPKGEGSNTLA